MAAALADRIVRTPYRRVRGALAARIERRNGIETEGIVWLKDAGFVHPDRIDYIPSEWLTLRRILRPREVGPEDVFLDLGAGKGRIVYLAARDYAFRRVIAVELVPELAAVARANVARTLDRLRCRDVELVVADALDYAIPDDVTVVYLFHPFKGDVFSRVVGNLVASLDRRPRAVRLIYRNPDDDGVATLLATGRATLARVTRGWRPGREWSRSNSTRMYVLR